MTADSGRLRKLIAKWRVEARDIRADGDYCCQITREHDADELEAALSEAAPVQPQEYELHQILKDAWEIRSACGFMWMRMAVAKDAQDAYDVAKVEFENHEAAFKRLETSLPAALHVRSTSAPGWQPIETAPHDDEVRLGAWITGAVDIIWWRNAKCRWGWSDCEQGDEQPTHWMPLPAPPTPAAGAPK